MGQTFHDLFANSQKTHLKVIYELYFTIFLIDVVRLLVSTPARFDPLLSTEIYHIVKAADLLHGIFKTGDTQHCGGDVYNKHM